jgi:hypothetical protein
MRFEGVLTSFFGFSRFAKAPGKDVKTPLWNIRLCDHAVNGRGYLRLAADWEINHPALKGSPPFLRRGVFFMFPRSSSNQDITAFCDSLKAFLTYKNLYFCAGFR